MDILLLKIVLRPNKRSIIIGTFKKISDERDIIASLDANECKDILDRYLLLRLLALRPKVNGDTQK